MEQKMIIYQVFTRLFGNKGLRNKMNGTLEESWVLPISGIQVSLPMLRKPIIRHTVFRAIIRLS